MLDRPHGERVSVGWLMGELGERSFGLTLLVMAIIALLLGASTIVGLLIAWPAIQLILGHDTAALPRTMARRLRPLGRPLARGRHRCLASPPSMSSIRGLRR
jgi:hypothetical protein